jgi:hypothetical protein
MKKLLVGAVWGFVALASGCWVPHQATSPSDNIVYIVVQKHGFARAGMVVRCDGPHSCVEVYRP